MSIVNATEMRSGSDIASFVDGQVVMEPVKRLMAHDNTFYWRKVGQSYIGEDLSGLSEKDLKKR